MPDTQVQPKIVQVPSIGNIQFPGDMPDDQISAAIQKNFPQLAPKPVLNPYQEASDRFVDPGNTSMSAGTKTYDQAHPKPQPGFFHRFAQGAGIPTTEGETHEAVSGMLNPQADPSETDPLVKKEEQIPILGSDFRARAALAKRADQETGGLRLAHKIASSVPLAGPAVTAAQDEYDKGNYAGALGAGLNALLSMEGLKAGVTPKTPELPVKSLGVETTEAAARPPLNPATPSAPLPTRTLSKILGGGEKAMAKAPIKQQSAAGRASNLEVAQYAKDHGIDLLPGQATGARGLQTVQAIGERAVVAPGSLPDVLEQQKANFGNLVDDFKKRVGTEAIPDTEAAGTSLQSQAHNGLDTLRKSAQDDYQAFQAQTGDIPVDLSEVKAKYGQKLADQAEALKNVPAAYANPVKNVLKKLSGIEAGGEVDQAKLATFEQAVKDYGIGPEKAVKLRASMGLPPEGGTAGVKMSTAQQLRSAYLDIARDYSGNVPKSVQRIAGQAAQDIDAAMAKSADSVGATDQWRAANAKWKQLQETYNNPEHPLYKIIQESDPVKVPTRLLGKGNYGGSPQTVRQLQQAGIDLSPLKREVAQQIAAKNFSLTNGGNGLGGFSTEFLKTLYSPAEFDELTKMGRIGRAIKFEVNPSGTSNILEGRHQLMGIIHGTVGATVGPLASRITTSHALRRAAMPGVDVPRSLPDIVRGPLTDINEMHRQGIVPPEVTARGTNEVTPQPESLIDMITRRGAGTPPALDTSQTYIRPSKMGTAQGIEDMVNAAKTPKTSDISRVDQHKIAKAALGESKSLSDILAAGKNTPIQAASYLDQAAQNLFGKPFSALTDAEKAKTYSEGARLQEKARGGKGGK